MFAIFLQYKGFEDYIGSVETWGSGTAPLPLWVQKEWYKRTGKYIAEGYGLSETTAVVSANPEKEPKPGSVGKPFEEIEVKILDENGKMVKTGEVGEIVVRGENVMKGYFKNSDETEKVLINGWLHTGDLGHFDEEGWLYIAGRKKELIIRGGFNILPSDVERSIEEHPAVLECAVKGVTDKIMGEEIAAYVVLREKNSVSEDELKEWLKARIAHNKVPRYIRFVPSLPRTPSGKIIKRKLDEHIT